MIRIVGNGQAFYSIIYPKNASGCNKFAAEELQNFIEKCTGVKLPIQTDEASLNGAWISVGNTRQYQALNYSFDFRSLNGDGFFIKGIKGNIYINADYERGLLFGVYDFLERYLGVRFIARDTTILPKTDCLEIETPDIVSVPDFRMRGYLESAMLIPFANSFSVPFLTDCPSIKSSYLPVFNPSILIISLFKSFVKGTKLNAS